MFLAHVLGILPRDLQYINELVEVIADDEFGSEVRKELGNIPLSEVDQNTLIESIFYRINSDVFSQIKQYIENATIEISNEAEEEKLLNLCQERIDKFSPYINSSLNSDFNNELDQVTIKGNTLGKIVDEIIPLLLENVRS